MKLEEIKKVQNVFKSNLNEISRGRCKSEEQKSELENIKWLCESQKAVNLMINLQLHLRLNTKQTIEKEFQVCQQS